MELCEFLKGLYEVFPHRGASSIAVRLTGCGWTPLEAELTFLCVETINSKPQREVLNDGGPPVLSLPVE